MAIVIILPGNVLHTVINNEFVSDKALPLRQ